MTNLYIVSTVAIILCLGQLGSAQLITAGDCPEHPVHQNFDVARYLGLWYEYRRYEQFFQRGGECVTAEYTLNDDGSVRVFNTMMVPPGQLRQSDTGRAVVSFPDEVPLQAKLNVTFDASAIDVTANYWVLDTDYDNFAVVWGCFEVGSGRRAENAWILSREPRLDQSVVRRVQDSIEKYLDEDELRRTIHDEDFCCSEEPEVTSHPACGLHHVMGRIRV